MTGTRQEGSSTLTLGVLVPAYDEEATIGDLLGRLLAVPGIDEVVVVDDGSTDATADVVEGLAARDARLRLVRQPENAGKTIVTIICDFGERYIQTVLFDELRYDGSDPI